MPLSNEDIARFLRSFASVGEAFYFFGKSTLPEVEAYVAGLSAAPILRTPPNTTILVFDTETTGLKPAIVCQLAYIVVERGIVTEYEQLLRLPPNVRIEAGAQRVHGISTHACAARGVDAGEALRAFARVCERVLASNGRVVAHNADFDVRAIRETHIAHGLVASSLERERVFCTMKASKPHSPLLNKAGRAKAFKNEELYAHLFGSPPTWAKLHDALDDVRVTAHNYAGGLAEGWW